MSLTYKQPIKNHKSSTEFMYLHEGKTDQIIKKENLRQPNFFISPGDFLFVCLNRPWMPTTIWMCGIPQWLCDWGGLIMKTNTFHTKKSIFTLVSMGEKTLKKTLCSTMHFETTARDNASWIQISLVTEISLAWRQTKSPHLICCHSVSNKNKAPSTFYSSGKTCGGLYKDLLRC